MNLWLSDVIKEIEFTDSDIIGSHVKDQRFSKILECVDFFEEHEAPIKLSEKLEAYEDMEDQVDSLIEERDKLESQVEKLTKLVAELADELAS